MKKVKITNRSNLKSVETTDGEYLEQKIERIMSQNEPIKDGAQKIYTEKKDGVLPSYNIRTDRWEIAQEAMSKVEAIRIAKKENQAEAAKKEAETKATEAQQSKVEQN